MKQAYVSPKNSPLIPTTPEEILAFESAARGPLTEQERKALSRITDHDDARRARTGRKLLLTFRIQDAYYALQYFSQTESPDEARFFAVAFVNSLANVHNLLRRVDKVADEEFKSRLPAVEPMRNNIQHVSERVAGEIKIDGKMGRVLGADGGFVVERLAGNVLEGHGEFSSEQSNGPVLARVPITSDTLNIAIDIVEKAFRVDV